MRITTTILLLFPLVIIGQKQYAPLGATWTYEGHEIDCLGNHIQYRVEKEVNVDGKDCSVIYNYNSSDVNPTWIKAQDSLIVWEDSNKVYFLEDTAFFLLYDFAAIVGDTIIHYDPVDRGNFSATFYNDPAADPEELKSVIESIDILSIGNVELKVFTRQIFDSYGSNPFDVIFIENIGSTYQGLTGDLRNYVASGCFGGLQCYKNESIDYETSLQFQTPPPGCDFIDSVDEAWYIGDLDIFPNPASDILHVAFPDSGSYQYAITVIQGNTLLSGI